MAIHPKQSSREQVRKFKPTCYNFESFQLVDEASIRPEQRGRESFNNRKIFYFVKGTANGDEQNLEIRDCSLNVGKEKEYSKLRRKMKFICNKRKMDFLASELSLAATQKLDSRVSRGKRPGNH